MSIYVALSSKEMHNPCNVMTKLKTIIEFVVSKSLSWDTYEMKWQYIQIKIHSNPLQKSTEVSIID